jgi:uncharacterized protein HemX
MKLTGKVLVGVLVLAAITAAVAMVWAVSKNQLNIRSIGMGEPSTPSANGQSSAASVITEPPIPPAQAASSINGNSTPSITAVRADDLLIAEVNATLIMLTDQIATTTQYTGAIAMLDLLSLKIQRADSPQRFAALAQAIASDRQALQAAASSDLSSLINTLDQFILQVDQLPLINASSLPPPVRPSELAAQSATQSAAQTPDNTATTATTTPTEPAGMSWASVWAGVRERLSEVVRIRRVDHAESLMMSEDRAAIMVERLRLRLLSARTALITRQPKVLEQDLAHAEKILNNAFDTASAQGMAAKNILQSIRKQGVAQSSVSLEKSMAEIKRLRPS